MDLEVRTEDQPPKTLRWNHLLENQFCEAAKSRDLIKLSKLMANGVDINYIDLSGRTALHHVCSNGYFEATKLLIANKALIDACDSNGVTPLHMAARHIVQLLILSKANLRVRCHSGCKAAELAPDESLTRQVGVFDKLNIFLSQILLDAELGILPIPEGLQRNPVPMVPWFSIQKEVDRQAKEEAKNAEKAKKGGKKGKRK